MEGRRACTDLPFLKPPPLSELPCSLRGSITWLQGQRNIFPGGGGGKGLTSDLKGGGGGLRDLSLRRAFFFSEKKGGGLKPPRTPSSPGSAFPVRLLLGLDFENYSTSPTPTKKYSVQMKLPLLYYLSLTSFLASSNAPIIPAESPNTLSLM